MYKLIASLFITLIITSNAQAAAQSDCRSLLLNFIHKADRNEMSAQIHIGWKEKETKKFLEDVRKMGFGFEDQRIIGQALVTADKTLTPERVKEYLFNTEEHTEQYKNDCNYISPEYLKQTIKFLNEE